VCGGGSPAETTLVVMDAVDALLAVAFTLDDDSPCKINTEADAAPRTGTGAAME